MALYLLIFSAIVVICIFFNKFSGKFGIPVLLLFLMLGLLCGSQYDRFASNWAWVVGDISTLALVFIMFYGGFGTRWKSAKPIALEAGMLSTLGVALTAAFVGLFCHFALGWSWLESLLMGAVISSTDAATVFSILRSRKLGLKNSTAPLLEMESGAVFLLKRISFQNNGFDMLLFIAIALVSYALPDLIGGNGYLSAYIVGIVLGNTDFPERKPLVSFFDAITSLMQIVIFFLLGMLAIPSNLLHSLLPALAIFAFLTLAARPLAVCGVLAPFRKYPFRQLGLISFVGLRGAASIVFAINILTSEVPLQNDIFSIVFCIVLVSIAFQGSLVPSVAKLTGMTDEGEDVMTTFSDFRENEEMSFGAIRITESSRWNQRRIMDLDLTQDCLIVLVLRGDTRIVPKGDTLLQAGDEIVLCTRSFQDQSTDILTRHSLPDDSKWAGCRVGDYPKQEGSLLVLIQRGDERIIPNGNTILNAGDVLVMLKRAGNTPLSK